MSPKPHSSHGSDQREPPQGSEQDDVKGEDPSKLPAHIQSVRDGLLDFNRFVGLRAAMLIAEENDEDVIPLSAYKPDSVGKSEQAREFEFVESARVWQQTQRVLKRRTDMNGTNYSEQL